MKPNKKSKKIAITGGIGSGKSTVSRILREKGFTVFSCDDIYKEVIVSSEYLTALKTRFPVEYFDENGEIDRKKLAKSVFENAQVREEINAISHPLIMRQLNECMEKINDEIVFAEVPLLFEGDFEHMFDGVLVVMADRAKRIENVQNRDGLRIDDIEKRMQSQFDYDSIELEKRVKACSAYILDNSSTIQDLERGVEQYLKSL